MACTSHQYLSVVILVYRDSVVDFPWWPLSNVTHAWSRNLKASLFPETVSSLYSSQVINSVPHPDWSIHTLFFNLVLFALAPPLSTFFTLSPPTSVSPNHLTPFQIHPLQLAESMFHPGATMQWSRPKSMADKSMLSLSSMPLLQSISFAVTLLFVETLTLFN
jgi:hypothetical protein